MHPKKQLQDWVMLFAGLVFVFFLVHRISLIFLPSPDIGGVENNVVYFIQRLLAGQALYTDPAQAPYAIAQYGPLYYYLASAIARVFGVSADDVMKVFSTGRIFSLVCNLLYCWIVFRTARKIFGISWRSCFLVAVLSFVFLDITAYARPDSLYQFLFFSALYFILKFYGERNAWNLILAAVLSTLAIFAKQSGIMLVFFTCAWLLWNKESKSVLYYVGGCFVAAAIVLLLASPNGIAVLYQNTVRGINSGISLRWFFVVMRDEFYQKWGLVLIPLFVFIFYARRNSEDAVDRFLIFLMAALFLINTLLAFKFGTSQGYFTEWWTILFILGVDHLDKLPVSGKTIAINAIIAFVFAIKLLSIVYPLVNYRQNYQQQLNVYKSEQQVASKIKSDSAAVSNTVFCNIYSPQSFLNNLLFRETVLPQFEIAIFGTYDRKIFDYSRFRTGFTDGSVKYVVSKNALPVQVFKDIRLEHFRIADSANGYFIYKYF
jgi:hypothetical protein